MTLYSDYTMQLEGSNIFAFVRVQSVMNHMQRQLSHFTDSQVLKK